MPNAMLSTLKDAAQIPGLLKEVYGDLARPGVVQVGKALNAVLGLGNTILWPVILLNEKAKIALERNLNKYREQLEKVPQEKVAEVPPEIGVPIAEKLAYVNDEQLSDLYINLLASASTIDYAHIAHPSFVNIINNLSPDEALLLQYIKDVLPFIEARYENNDGSGYKAAGRLLTGLEQNVKLYFPQNIVAYLSNYEGLGLINIRDDMHLTDPTFYDELERVYRPKYEQEEYDKSVAKLTFQKGLINLTPFGQMFISACLKKLDPS